MAKISLESYDSGSNYSFGDKMEQARYPRSAFNLSHKLTTTYENAGQVQPIFIHRVNPNEDFSISVKSLFRALPSVVPLYSRQRDYIYFFGARMTDLWDNASTFMTKGYTGDVIKKIPVLSSDYNYSYEEGDVVESGSLADNLGIPIGTPAENLEGINALPFMFLFRVFRDYFVNRNYYINDRLLLPDNDTRFRLNDNGELLSAKDLGISFTFNPCKNTFAGYVTDFDNSKATFTQFCHDWPQDYFTSALPWPQRGTATTLDTSLTNTAMNIALQRISKDNPLIHLGEYQEAIYSDTDKPDYHSIVFDKPLSHTKQGLGPSDHYGLNGGSTQVSYSYNETSQYSNEPTFNTMGVHIPSNSFSGTASITLQDLRELAVNQTELEKLARTDGSFAEFGISFFGQKSKNAILFKPTYIGGTYSNIQYTEVLQTSAQYEKVEGTVSPIGSPLGTYGGHGICANNGYVGNFHSDEHGFIMALHCVMPDVYYSQGLDRMWTDLYQSDMVIPERAKLGLRPILNKELFFTGTEDDDNLWAYQNIYDEYRYLPNRISGKIADPDELNFIPYTQSRIFTELINYGHEFAEANNVRKDYLQASEEVAFTCEFAFEIRGVRCLPYKPIPANILN